MKYEELKVIRQEGVELAKKGLFQDAQIKLYKAFNSSEEFTEFHLEVGLDLVALYRRIESYSAALELIDYIIDHKHGTNYFRSSAYLDRALIEYRQRDFDKAFESVNKAEALFNGSFPISKHWYLAIVKGRIFQKQGSIDKAIEYFSNALKIGESYGHDRHLQITYDNLGEALIVSGKVQNGIEFTQQALSISEGLGDLFYQAIHYQTLMYAAFKQGNLASAKENAVACLKLAYENNYRDVVRDVCYQIGRYYKDHGQKEVAEVFFRKSANADGRLSYEFLKDLSIDIVNSRGTSLGEA
jgi:tetratricopeptide (TPR) repeat protein